MRQSNPKFPVANVLPLTGIVLAVLFAVLPGRADDRFASRYEAFPGLARAEFSAEPLFLGDGPKAPLAVFVVNTTGDTAAAASLPLNLSAIAPNPSRRWLTCGNNKVCRRK
jgi:hypothetical protein